MVRPFVSLLTSLNQPVTSVMPVTLIVAINCAFYLDVQALLRLGVLEDFCRLPVVSGVVELRLSISVDGIATLFAGLHLWRS